MAKKNSPVYVERFVLISRSQHLEFPSMESLNSYVQKFQVAFPEVDLSDNQIYKFHIYKIK